MDLNSIGVTIIQLADSFRLVVFFLMAVANAMLSKMVYEHFVSRKSGPYKSTPYIIMSVMILSIGCAFDLISRIGTEPTWRIPIYLFGIGLAIYATWKRNQELDNYYKEQTNGPS